MRYAQSQYAQAFIQLVDRYPEHSDALCDGLFRALKHNGDYIKARAVIAAIEKEFMRRDGITSAMVISAHPLSTALRDRLQNAINGNVIMHQRIDPNVIGGAKIIINETTMVDATLARKLKQLFPHASLTV